MALDHMARPVQSEREEAISRTAQKSILGHLVFFSIVDIALSGQRSTRLSRRALVITETEDRLIAAAAIMGESKRPVKG